MNIKEKFNNNRRITIIDRINESCANCNNNLGITDLDHTPINESINSQEINRTQEDQSCKGGFDYLLNQTKYDAVDDRINNESSAIVTKECFDKIYHAFKYLEGEIRHAPDFSIMEVSRLAIALYHDMYDSGYYHVTGIEYQESWTKEDLGLFISNLFETLLDFLDRGKGDISGRN